MSILVTGSAGFVGSILTRELLDRGIHVVGLDNLQQGHREAVPAGVDFIEGDVGNAELLRDIFHRFNIESVVHLAAEALVGPSMTDPVRYFRNNVASPITLLDVMLENGVDRMIFSSSAAVYGDPESVPIPEDASLKPVNSYGESKLMFETILKWHGRAYGLKHAILRFFNVAGALPEAGESHEPETHLLPVVLSVALGQRPGVDVFGTDFPTRDGSCIRDYVHVSDIVEAHLLCLESLDKIGDGIYNLGNGGGYSVLEVIESARRVTGHKIPAFPKSRRAGDPATLVADHRRIGNALGWRPRKPELDDIVESAWLWHKTHPRGYA